MLILENELKLNSNNGNITSVCLPNKDTLIEVNHKCNIVGFGMTQYEEEAIKKTPSSSLRHADIRLVPIETCNRAKAFNSTVNETMTVCAGDGTAGVSPCYMDSGGALACDVNGKGR